MYQKVSVLERMNQARLLYWNIKSEIQCWYAKLIKKTPSKIFVGGILQYVLYSTVLEESPFGAMYLTF